jgi:CBS-domain-containing membrane protein
VRALIRLNPAFRGAEWFPCSEQEGGVRASDVMSTIVVTAKPETTIEGICQQKINHRISGAPVVAGDGWPVGMVARNDLSRGSQRPQGPGRNDRMYAMTSYCSKAERRKVGIGRCSSEKNPCR